MLTFPSLPDTATADERWEALHQSMAVPELPGVYVLGCFARYATIYSQQVRALNLIDALCSSGRLRQGSRIAVIGAGIAGLTAACAAAVRGVEVHVLETVDAPNEKKGRMRLQRTSIERYVHPYIYDWPDSAEGDRTDLPLLNWDANTADQVVAKLDEEFLSIVQETGRIHLDQSRLEEPTISVTGIGVRLGRKGQTTWKEVDAVILAVGYGIETETGVGSYWSNNNLDSAEAEGRKWLVSGFGDGALTDLMRLCLPLFRHGEALRLFINAVPSTVRDAILEIEAECAENELSQHYLEQAKLITLDLGTRNTTVFLNSTLEQLFSRRSSILNRLIAAWLYNHDYFRLVDEPGMIETVNRGGDTFRVVLKDGRQWDGYQGVVCRHGPVRALQLHFGPAVGATDGLDIWSRCKPLEDAWASIKQGADWTRKPWWPAGAFASPPDCPLWVSNNANRCVLVSGAVPHDNFRVAIEEALDRLELPSELEIVIVERAFTTPAHYARAVHAVSSCRMAVFDLNEVEKNPGVMVLLGIRSVSRRGITVTFRDHKDEKAGTELPFNVRELSTLDRSVAAHLITNRLQQAIEAGAEMLAMLPSTYLDLPAFDAVRKVGTRPEYYRPIPPKDQVLVLCWFHETYDQGGGSNIIGALDSKAGGGRSVRIIDTASPQLAGQKLYEAIRRTQMCVVDWTGWRPNVLFEFGVRIAVNPLTPLVLLRSDQPIARAPAGLDRLFEPFVYDIANLGPFREERDAWFDALASAPPGVPARGKASAGLTYRLVRDAIDLRQEPGGLSVVGLLKENADAMLSPDVRQYGSLPALFADNPSLEDQLRRRGAELLLTAWQYCEVIARIRERVAIGELSKTSEEFREYLELGEHILATLDDSFAPEFVRARADVETALSKAYAPVAHA